MENTGAVTDCRSEIRHVIAGYRILFHVHYSKSYTFWLW